jgi:hypothetical protein
MLNYPKYYRELYPSFTRHFAYHSRYQVLANAVIFTPPGQTNIMKPSLIWEFMNAAVYHYDVFIRIGNSRHPQFTFSYKNGPTFSFIFQRITH